MNAEFYKSVHDALYLFSASPDHRIYTLSEFLDFAVAPITTSKIRFFYSEGRPRGLVTWCWLTEAEAGQFLDECWTPTVDVFRRNSGEQLWGIDFIAPFGNTIQVMREMRRHSKRLYGENTNVHWRRFKQPDKLIIRRF